MMKRLTNRSDKNPCRIIDCWAEEWIANLTGTTFSNWNSDEDVCDNCPFEKYINRLAEYEDEKELMEDDGK